jgi:serine/threonine-protein kinase RsbW
MINNIDELDELSEGGRGLQLMWQLTDELNYTHTPPHKNCLLLVKNFPIETVDNSEQLNEFSNLKPVKFFFNRFKFINGKGNLQNPIGNRLLQKICLKVNTDLNTVAQVLQWYEQLEYLPIPKKILDQCKLALIEGFTNAVRHAHKGMPIETPIELEVTVFKGRLEMKIWDYGQPFDLQARLREILSSKSTFSTQRN